MGANVRKKFPRTFVPGSKSSREQMGRSESARVLLAASFLGLNWSLNEEARYPICRHEHTSDECGLAHGTGPISDRNDQLR